MTIPLECGGSKAPLRDFYLTNDPNGKVFRRHLGQPGVQREKIRS